MPKTELNKIRKKAKKIQKAKHPKKKLATKPLPDIINKKNPERVIVWWYMQNLWGRYFYYEANFWGRTSFLANLIEVLLIILIFDWIALVPVYHLPISDFLGGINILFWYSVINMSLIIGYYIYFLQSYRKFRYWRLNLPFKLIGWENVVNQSVFNKNHWTKCTITVTYRGRSNRDAQDFVKNAFTIFMDKANRWFYQTPVNQGLKDCRTKWKTKDAMHFTGSINTDVAREFRNICIGYLTKIQQTYKCIDSITLTCSCEPCHVSILLPSSSEPGYE